jgi:tetratricopeptide (TPR) repeat protein
MSQTNYGGINYQIETGQGNKNFFGGKHHHHYSQAPALPDGIPQNLPHSGTVSFVGRDLDLQNIHEHFKRKEIVAISGMGGVGKTELALQYAYEQCITGTYPGGVCWLQAQDADIGIQIVTFSIAQLQLNPPDDLDLSSQVAFCWRHWQLANTLIVFDDVTAYKRVKPYLPPANSQFRVLITTRERLQPPIMRLDLDILQPRAALSLLQSLIDQDRLRHEPWVARRLCRRLGYLPLGIELIGRYLAQKPDLSLLEMEHRLEEKGLNQRSLQSASEEMTAQRGVSAAFELSWQELDDNAQRLGYLLSIFALSPIPWSLVERCLSDHDPEDIEDSRDSGLINLNLLKRSGREIYRLHQLIREFFKSKLRQSDQVDIIQEKFCQAMAEVSDQISATFSIEEITENLNVIPHILESTNLRNWLSDQLLICPYTGLTRFYESQGLYKQSAFWLEQFLAIAPSRLGETHPSIASSLDYLAYIYNVQGKYSEAEPLYFQALEMRRHLFGEEHIDISSSFDSIGYFYIVTGRYSEAELYCQQAVEMRMKILKGDHVSVAQSLNCLAYLYSVWKRYPEAEMFYLQALAMRRRLFGEHHFHIAQTMNSLADVYIAEGKYIEAEPLCIQALEMRRRLLGAEHPDIARSLCTLAYLYKLQAQYSEAEPLYEQAVQLFQKTLGEEHPVLATTLSNVAELSSLQGRYEEAENLYEQALVIAQQKLGMEHPTTLNIRDRLTVLPGDQS